MWGGGAGGGGYWALDFVVVYACSDALFLRKARGCRARYDFKKSVWFCLASVPSGRLGGVTIYSSHAKSPTSSEGFTGIMFSNSLNS